MAGDCVTQLLSRVAAVREDMAQPGEALAYCLEHIDGAVPVLNIGGMDQDQDQEAAGVGKDMALAPLDLLARVIATNPATFGGFDRLAVDDPGAGRGFAAFDFAQAHHQRHVDRIVTAVSAPRRRDRRNPREAVDQRVLRRSWYGGRWI